VCEWRAQGRTRRRRGWHSNPRPLDHELDALSL